MLHGILDFLYEHVEIPLRDEIISVPNLNLVDLRFEKPRLLSRRGERIPEFERHIIPGGVNLFFQFTFHPNDILFIPPHGAPGPEDSGEEADEERSRAREELPEGECLGIWGLEVWQFSYH